MRIAKGRIFRDSLRYQGNITCTKIGLPKQIENFEAIFYLKAQLHFTDIHIFGIF